MPDKLNFIKNPVKVTSYSSVAQNRAMYDLKDQVSSMDGISHIICFGPADLNSLYGGIFFYGIHSIQTLIMIFGEDIKKVRISRSNNNARASLIFLDGRLATLIYKNQSGGWEIFVENKEGLVKLIPRVQEPDPGINYADMVEMFPTGKEPVSHSNILTSVVLFEALEKSAISDCWEDVSFGMHLVNSIVHANHQ